MVNALKNKKTAQISENNKRPMDVQFNEKFNKFLQPPTKKFKSDKEISLKNGEKKPPKLTKDIAMNAANMKNALKRKQTPLISVNSERPVDVPFNQNLKTSLQFQTKFFKSDKAVNTKNNETKTPQMSENSERPTDVPFNEKNKKLSQPPTKKFKSDKEINSKSGKKKSPKLTKDIAIDCEMVGAGKNGSYSMLARVSLVNSLGECLYDQYVKPRAKITNYRTRVSGIRPRDLKNGKTFYQVQKEVKQFLNGRILVGHSIENDLKVLFLTHPLKYIRDTSRSKYFIQLVGGKTPSLKELAALLLDWEIQSGEHCSVQDAQATMLLYKMHENKWEEMPRKLSNNNRKK